MSFESGDKVFAKIKGFSFWPARINPLPDHVRVPKGKLPIFFYGTHQVSFVPIKAVVNFQLNQEKLGKPKVNAAFTYAMEEILSNPHILMLGKDPDAVAFCQRLYPNGSNDVYVDACSASCHGSGSTTPQSSEGAHLIEPLFDEIAQPTPISESDLGEDDLSDDSFASTCNRRTKKCVKKTEHTTKISSQKSKLAVMKQSKTNAKPAIKRGAAKKPATSGKKLRQTEEIFSDHDSLSSVSSISDNDEDSYKRSEAARKAEIEVKLRELEEKRQKEEEKAIRKAERHASKSSRKRIREDELEPSPSYSPILPLGLSVQDANVSKTPLTPASVVESIHGQVSPSLGEMTEDQNEVNEAEQAEGRKAARKLEKKEEKKAAKYQAKLDAKKKAKAAELKQIHISSDLASPSSTHDNEDITYSPIMTAHKTDPSPEVTQKTDIHNSPDLVDCDDETSSQKPLISRSPSPQISTAESETEIRHDDEKSLFNGKLTVVNLDSEEENEEKVIKPNRKRKSLLSSDSDAEVNVPKLRKQSVSSEVDLMEEEEKSPRRSVKKSVSKKRFHKVSLDSSSDEEEENPNKRKQVKAHSFMKSSEPKINSKGSPSPVRVVRSPSPDPVLKLSNFNRQLKASLVRGHENFVNALRIFTQICDVPATLLQLTQAWELTDCVKKCRRYKLSSEIREAAQKTLTHFQSIQAKASKEEVQQAQAIVTERVKQTKALAAFNSPSVVQEPVPESKVENLSISDSPAVPILPTWEEKRASITAELDARVNEVLNRIRVSDERVAANKFPEITVNNNSHITLRYSIANEDDEDERVISKVEEVAQEFEEAEASRQRKSSVPPPSNSDLETRIRMMTEGGPPPPPPPPLQAPAVQLSSLPADLLAKRHQIAHKLAAKKAATAAAKSSLMPEKMATATPMRAGGGCSQDDDIYDLLGV